MSSIFFKQPHPVLFLFGAILLLVALFTLADSQRRASLETARPLPGMIQPGSAHP